MLPAQCHRADAESAPRPPGPGPQALAAQRDAPAGWELLVIDNGSTPPLAFPEAPVPLRVVVEPRPGLLHARLAGLNHSRGDVILFLDDDTIPHPGSLASLVEFTRRHPRVGVAGGRIHPQFEAPPPPWIDACAWALALRNWGDAPLSWSTAEGGALPAWSPIGAGLVVRRDVVATYAEHVARHAATIERISWHGQGVGGTEDKDLVLCVLRHGWAMGYVPGLVLEHVIPAGRLQPAYFERLVPNLQRLWMQTLFAHGFNRRPTVPPWSVPFRVLKAWFVFRAWRGLRERMDWWAARGSLAGLAAMHRRPVRYPPAMC
ncbi:MAG: glycosyltransferase [Verrucomicrobia bacterium]|nr:glycosyltransferase [Verrucomicrobiota bacterium]